MHFGSASPLDPRPPLRIKPPTSDSPTMIKLTGIADEAGASLDVQIQAHKELGWDSIESRVVEFDGVKGNLHEIPDAVFDKVVARLEEKGMGVCGFGSLIGNWAKKITDDFSITEAEIGRAIPRMQRLGAKVVSHVTQLGDTPHLEKLIGPVKVMIDAFQNGELDEVYIVYSRFINTMKQEPQLEQLLPLTGERLGTPEGNWDYLYEPDAQVVIDELLVRYVEALVYQAVAENMASEQSARMVAMKAASDNAGNVIGELQLVYNKTRQAAITKELSEIVGGAAAV